ncbi:MAG: PfkB family carbohydrate kinase [bacterium]|nr:PfkB family carbohydrate kinase [bacterium]
MAIITLFSTLAKDTLVDNDGNTIKEQVGGPAFYLLKIFRKEKISTITKLAGPVGVQILVNEYGEFGKIPKIPKKIKIDFKKVNTPFSVISTLLDEFNLQSLDKYKGKIFLDIQGYVRDGLNFGKKQSWRPPPEIMNNIFCLKGTEEELSYLPEKFLRIQKQKILLITRGGKGCKVFTNEKFFTVKPDQIIETSDTIGTGDTFFAYFIAQFLKTGDVVASGQWATEQTARFLTQKLSS